MPELWLVLTFEQNVASSKLPSPGPFFQVETRKSGLAGPAARSGTRALRWRARSGDKSRQVELRKLGEIASPFPKKYVYSAGELCLWKALRPRADYGKNRETNNKKYSAEMYANKD